MAPRWPYAAKHTTHNHTTTTQPGESREWHFDACVGAGFQARAPWTCPLWPAPSPPDALAAAKASILALPSSSPTRLMRWASPGARGGGVPSTHAARLGRGATSIGEGGAAVAANAARIASRPLSLTEGGAALTCCRSRSIRAAPSGCSSSRKRPQHASTRASTRGELPPAFCAAASQRLCSCLCCNFK